MSEKGPNQNLGSTPSPEEDYVPEDPASRRLKRDVEDLQQELKEAGFRDEQDQNPILAKALLLMPGEQCSVRGPDGTEFTIHRDVKLGWAVIRLEK